MSEQHLILVADDSDEDILFIRRAFEQGGVANPVLAVNSGEEAISYLKGEGRYSDREEYPLPDCLI